MHTSSQTEQNLSFCMQYAHYHYYKGTGLPGKHGMCISWVHSLCHKPEIIHTYQSDIIRTSGLWTASQSKQQAARTTVHSINKRESNWNICHFLKSFHCIRGFHRSQFISKTQLYVNSLCLNTMGHNTVNTEHTGYNNIWIPFICANMPRLLFIIAVISLTLSTLALISDFDSQREKTWKSNHIN